MWKKTDGQKVRVTQVLGVTENPLKSAHPNIKYVVKFRYAHEDNPKKEFTKTVRIGDVKN